MRALFLLVLIKFFLFSVSPSGKTLLSVGVLAGITNCATAQIKQPSSSNFPLLREWRIYMGQLSGAPDPYILPVYFKVDTLYNLFFPITLSKPSASTTDKIAAFGTNNDFIWISKDSLFKDYITDTIMDGFIPYADTVPSGNIVTAYDMSLALSTMDQQMGSKVDTGVLVDYYLASNPDGYISSVPAQSFSSLTGKPTTLSGYGIVDAYPLIGNPSGFISGLSSFTTTNLTEGTNEYFTTARARLSVAAGSGIGYNSSTGLISNAAPDQTVVLTNGTNINVSGTYPNFTINSTALALPSLGSPDQLLRVNAGDSVAEWFTPSFLTANQTITLSGDVTGSGTTGISTTLANSGVSAGTYDWVTVDAKGRVTTGANTPVPTAITAGARNFNTAYQISSTRPSRISVSAQISCTLSLAGGQAGEVVLEISPNGTSGWIYSGQITASNTGTLTVGLNTVQLSGAELIEDLPAGYYWRLRTNNTTGTPTYTFNGGSFRIY